ncbi:hypothetical protein RUND412_002976 [Rhizina undulata]
MANAMKKLKLLHHLTAASTNATPLPAPPASQFAQAQSVTASLNGQLHTPPTSPINPRFHPNSNYTDVPSMLRNARQALHLHQHPEQFRSSYQPMAYAPAPPPPVLGKQACLLPQAFMVLTPNDPHPAICLPASPPPQHSHITPLPIAPLQALEAVPRGNTTIYSSRPPTYSPSIATTPRRPSSRRQKLTVEAVGNIGKDSRMARWERVVGYVRDQRKAAISAASESGIEIAHEMTDGREAASVYIEEMDRKNRQLEMLDLEEQDQKSLWSGGSGGTNGVDEFVWSEDEDDVPNSSSEMQKSDGYRPAHVEEGIFTLDQEAAEPMDVDQGAGTGTGRKRPMSFPGELDARMWMGGCELRREAMLEGGLERLAERERRASLAC